MPCEFAAQPEGIGMMMRVILYLGTAQGQDWISVQDISSVNRVDTVVTSDSNAYSL